MIQAEKNFLMFYAFDKFCSQVVTQYGARLTLEEAEELLKEADLDGDGKLNYNEFVQMMSWDLDDG